MRTCSLILALAGLTPATAFALKVDNLPATELRRYSAALAEHASNSQWQRLWQNTRHHGQFASTGIQPRFTLPMREIPPLVRLTLAEPHQWDNVNATMTRLRRDFTPHTLGYADGRELSAMCVWVDWRAAPHLPAGRALRAQDVFYVRLKRAKPC